MSSCVGYTLGWILIIVGSWVFMLLGVGVVVELITREKPLSFMRSPGNRSLATYFNLSMKENKVDTIDAPIAQVARRCLNLKRTKGPCMRQVSMELERIRSSLEDMQSYVHDSENEEGVVEVNIWVESRNNVTVTTSASQYNVVALSLSWSDVEPFFPLQTRSKTPTLQTTE